MRPLQEQAIRAGLEQRDSLVVMPTGGGKSLCYQVPAELAQRTDIVVSPLIAPESTPAPTVLDITYGSPVR